MIDSSIPSGPLSLSSATLSCSVLNSTDFIMKKIGKLGQRIGMVVRVEYELVETRMKLQGFLIDKVPYLTVLYSSDSYFKIL